MRGVKLLSLGGGNAAGEFDANSIAATATPTAIAAIIAAGYGGVMYDVEEVNGPAADTVPAFAAAFAALKNSSLLVGVTVSHSAPYQTDTPEDAVALAKAFAGNPDVDIISPQLYSSGDERKPDFAETNSCIDAGCTWSVYAGTRANFAPSVVDDTHYAPTITYFHSNHDIDVGGYFVWAQEKNKHAAAEGGGGNAAALQSSSSSSSSSSRRTIAAVASLIEGAISGDCGVAVNGSAATNEQNRLAGWVQARLLATYPR